FPWHQDFPFWPVNRPQGVVVWIPLDDAGVERGGLAFARGSHRLGPRPVVDLHVGTPQDCHAELGFDPSSFEIVRPRYNRGDAVAFLPTTFHGSPEVIVEHERQAWSSAWLHPEVRWHHANAPNHPLCQHVRDGAPVRELDHAN
ncbi:MAG: phytanoyl-CoA dioxygenase family protein, partial [Nannocystaceae bacterium]